MIQDGVCPVLDRLGAGHSPRSLTLLSPDGIGIEASGRSRWSMPLRLTVRLSLANQGAQSQR
ncbi:predicted protein [Streptomyces iranensis]|uniref:Uncharacterized protein n=1 Tax=Streptomyces iranensis TaxID=576784 RepID=A0A061A5N2_9ACTN|nr:predicted protein [Streptomyces iranensis]